LTSGRNGFSNVNVKKAIEDGEVIYASFKGKWRGSWHQNGTSRYRHHWHTPESVDGVDNIWVQAVVMWPIQNDNSLGKERFLAINSVSKLSGTLLGAVGIKGNQSERPHIGFYINSKTLIWVAQEGMEGPHKPRYSIFYEWLTSNCDQYLIKGIGFNWSRSTQKLDSIHYKWGEYSREI